MNKTVRTTITVVCTQEYYDKNYPKMRSQVDSGAAMRKFLTEEDLKDGMVSAEIILEDLSE